MWNHALTLLTIMLVSGGLGGIVNYLLEKRTNPDGSSLFRSVFTGVAASLLVPLFLNMISSDLIVKSELENDKLFVFAGFCIIASISSSAFIRRISDKILQEVQEARKVALATKNAVAPIIRSYTEADQEMPLPSTTMERHDLDASSVAILNALLRDRLIFRSLRGIAHDAGVPMENARQNLDVLTTKGLTGLWESEMGLRWYITEKGHGHAGEGAGT